MLDTNMAFEYSTTGVEPTRRFEYWNDVVCRHCIPAASRMLTDGPLDGRLAVRSVGVVDISAMTAPLHRWSRDTHHLRIRDDDDLWIGYMRAGQGAVEQGGRQAHLRDRDMTLYDAARPFNFTPATQIIYLVRFPRRPLLQRYPAAVRDDRTSLRDRLRKAEARRGRAVRQHPARPTGCSPF